MKRARQTIKAAVMLLVLCAAPSCLYYPSSESGSTTPFKYRHAEEEYLEWCNDLPRYLIPRTCAYYQLHPERFTPIGHGEEIEIRGFADFVKDDSYFKKGHRASVWAGKVRDPWGDPIHFVQDLNMDGYIEAGGVRRNIWAEAVNGPVEFTNQQHHFGILKQNSFNGPYGNPWERIFAVTFYDARQNGR